MPRLNLITNPSFKTNTTGWTGVSATLLQTTNQYLFGASSLEFTTTASSGTSAYASVSGLTAGASYALSAYVRSAAVTRGAYVQVTWKNSGGSDISSSTGATLTTATTDWTRLSVVATAPAGAVSATCRLVVVPNAASEVHYFDGVLMEASAYVNEYFDDLGQGQENNAMDLALKRVPNPHLTGAELNADIALGMLVFNTVDEDGVVWVITGVDGWWNLPTPSVPTVERGFADGSYDVRGRFESRAITLTGVILPPNRAKLPAARAKLLNAANLVYRGDWLRLDEGPVKACYVRLIGQPTIDTVNPRGRTEFSLQLRAADPIKYEWVPGTADGRAATAVAINSTDSSGGTTTLTNSGTASVQPSFKVTGPVYGTSAIKNTSTGKTLTLVSSLRPARSFTVTNRATDSAGTSTLTLSVGRHNVSVGDTVVVGGVAAGYNGTFAVTAKSTTTISYYTGLFTEGSTASGGTVSAAAETLEIDTYAREAAFNGVVEGSRSRIDTLVDWVALDPGPNQVGFYNNDQTPAFIAQYYRAGGTSTLYVIPVNVHYFYGGDRVSVTGTSGAADGAFPVEYASVAAALRLTTPASTAITTVTMGPVVYTDVTAQAVTSVAWNNTTKIVTLVTESAHGMTEGDYITVAGGNTTVVAGLDCAVAAGALIDVSTYFFTSAAQDLLTLNLASSHGYTAGDEVEVTGMGGDFNGVFVVDATSSAAKLVLLVTSSSVSLGSLGSPLTAPSEAKARRVYRIASTPTSTQIHYKKSSASATTATTAVPVVAGKLRGSSTTANVMAYHRSGWIS